MRHGWTISRILIVLGVALGGFTRHARGGEPTDDRLGMRTVPIVLLTRSDVQRDLKLDPKQVDVCRQRGSCIYDRAARLSGRKDAGATGGAKGGRSRNECSGSTTISPPNSLTASSRSICSGKVHRRCSAGHSSMKA